MKEKNFAAAEKAYESIGIPGRLLKVPRIQELSLSDSYSKSNRSYKSTDVPLRSSFLMYMVFGVKKH